MDTIPDIKMRGCHEGFKPVGLTCVCMDYLDEGVARCDPDGKTVYLEQGYWAGNVDGEFLTNRCPADYCNFSESAIPGEYQYFSGHVCKGGRDQNSVLCGACKPGYSILFGNENCANRCTDRWLWIIIILGLFIGTCFVLLVNPNLSSGHLNACLYAYQIMKILTPDGFNYDPLIEFLAGLSNLRIDIGDGICFARGLNNAQKLMIMAGFAFLEIVILMLLRIPYPLWRRALQKLYGRSQHSQCCTGTCRNVLIRLINNLWESFNERVENGFAYAYCSIAILCYVNITDVSLQLLHSAKVGGREVVFVDGNMEFFVNGHLYGYGCVAIVLLIIVVCVPFFFIFYRSNPQIETLRACFKPRRGCFLSYYLLCRGVLLAISTYVQASPLKSALLQFCCIVFLFVIAVARPYKEDQRGDEPNESQRAGNHTAEAHRATSGGSSDGDEAQEVAAQGGHGAAEAQREENQGGNNAADRRKLANQAAPGNGLQDERLMAATQTAVQNRWTNESDVVILTALSGIAILSSSHRRRCFPKYKIYPESFCRHIGVCPAGDGSSSLPIQVTGLRNML